MSWDSYIHKGSVYVADKQHKTTLTDSYTDRSLAALLVAAFELHLERSVVGYPMFHDYIEHLEALIERT